MKFARLRVRRSISQRREGASGAKINVARNQSSKTTEIHRETKHKYSSRDFTYRNNAGFY